MSKSSGLENRYQVVKRSNPHFPVDAIVLEWNDPIARVGIRAWVEECAKQGYLQLYSDVLEKLDSYVEGELQDLNSSLVGDLHQEIFQGTMKNLLGNKDE